MRNKNAIAALEQGTRKKPSIIARIRAILRKDFTDLQNPTRAKVEVDWLSCVPHVLGMRSKRDGHLCPISQEILFCAEAHFWLLKVNEERYRGKINNFFCLNVPWCGWPLVLTRLCFLPYSQRNKKFIEGISWGAHYPGVASKILRFITAELFLVGRLPTQISRGQLEKNIRHTYGSSYCEKCSEMVISSCQPPFSLIYEILN